MPRSLSRTPPKIAKESPFALVRQEQRRFAFVGPPGHVRTLSHAQVLTGDFAPGTFRDRIVLVGATVAGMGDLLPTPVSGQGQPMPGVEIHANALDAMRSGHIVREVPLAWTLAIGVLRALAPLAWLPRTHPLGGLVATTAWFFAVMAAAVALPVATRAWWPPAAALLAILVAYPVWSWRRLESAGRFLDHELKRLRQQLGSEEGLPLHALPRDPFAARIRQVQAASYRLRQLQKKAARNAGFSLARHPRADRRRTDATGRRTRCLAPARAAGPCTGPGGKISACGARRGTGRRPFRGTRSRRAGPPVRRRRLDGGACPQRAPAAFIVG